jgi:hypothetical protein
MGSMYRIIKHELEHLKKRALKRLKCSRKGNTEVRTFEEKSTQKTELFKEG